MVGRHSTTRRWKPEARQGPKKPGVMGIGAVTSELRKAGFTGGETSEGKANLFRHAALEHPVYVKTSTANAPRMRAPLIVHPDYQDLSGSWLEIDGLEIGTKALYHNSGLSEFLPDSMKA